MVIVCLYLCVDTLVRDLSRNLVGADRLLNGRPPEAEIGADEGERDRDAEPEGEQRHQREEGNGRRAPVVPQHLHINLVQDLTDMSEKNWRQAQKSRRLIGRTVRSVADSGCLSRIPDPNFSIPDPES
jgi:hypothetical protein